MLWLSNVSDKKGNAFVYTTFLSSVIKSSLVVKYIYMETKEYLVRGHFDNGDII